MRNDQALSPAGMIFGVFMLLVLMASVVLIISTASNAPSQTDTYGTSVASADTAANGTQGLVSNVTATGASVTAPIIVLAAVVFVCFCGVLVYAYVKTY